MIRLILDSEIDICTKLIQNSFQIVADEFKLTANYASWFTSHAITSDTLKYQLTNENRLMYVFTESEILIGFCSLIIRPNKQCELNSICVEPDHRHLKIGSTLLQVAIQTAKSMGCRTVKTCIMKDNILLNKWFESFGFVSSKSQKNDYLPHTCFNIEKSL